MEAHVRAGAGAEDGREGGVKLLVFSDLHLEHRPDWGLPTSFPAYDVAIAAGDIDGSPAESIRRLASNPGLQGKPIVFVAGNHEYYYGTLEDRIEEGRVAAVEAGVHFLDADSVTIDGVRFLGCTLWSDYRLYGNPVLGVDDAAKGMNDHRYIKRRAIKRGDKGRYRFAPKEAAWHHQRQRTFIERELATPHDGPTVVVTHHAPSRQSIPARFEGVALNVAYASNLESLILQWQPALWIHGHIHDSADYTIGTTRVRSNPKGYGPGAEFKQIENPAFDPGLVIDVPQPAPNFTAPRSCQRDD
jgi:Icc-related predicted phosphoesterase